MGRRSEGSIESSACLWPAQAARKGKKRARTSDRAKRLIRKGGTGDLSGKEVEETKKIIKKVDWIR